MEKQLWQMLNDAYSNIGGVMCTDEDDLPEEKRAAVVAKAKELERISEELVAMIQERA